jgi:ubiquinone/menaquinone biosynthesis C-methylase UbiE
MTLDRAPIERMPRGGFDASWLDRKLETTRAEYTDRQDIPQDRRRSVIRYLDRVGDAFGLHDECARVALELLTDTPNPRILELGAGHGKLSARLVELHPTVEVVVSDNDPDSVRRITDGELGSHPRVTTEVVDATAIDFPDRSFELVILVFTFHHLPPETAHNAIAEATRVGSRFLVCDFQRPSGAKLLTWLASTPGTVPLSVLLRVPSAWWGSVHDYAISLLRSYSPSAFTALGRAVSPDMRIAMMPFGPKVLHSHAVVYSRDTDLRCRR